MLTTKGNHLLRNRVLPVLLFPSKQRKLWLEGPREPFSRTFCRDSRPPSYHHKLFALSLHTAPWEPVKPVDTGHRLSRRNNSPERCRLGRWTICCWGSQCCDTVRRKRWKECVRMGAKRCVCGCVVSVRKKFRSLLRNYCRKQMGTDETNYLRQALPSSLSPFFSSKVSASLTVVEANSQLLRQDEDSSLKLWWQKIGWKWCKEN